MTAARSHLPGGVLRASTSAASFGIFRSAANCLLIQINHRARDWPFLVQSVGFLGFPRAGCVMTIEQLRAAREANPFRPFTIDLADGRSLPVPHRDYLSMSPGGRTAIVYQ